MKSEKLFVEDILQQSVNNVYKYHRETNGGKELRVNWLIRVHVESGH